jgi:MinD-like ATPase involved in chromosome partitioning or flagellar assembly
MQEALALVRQELGSQAAVLHTREVRSRGLARLWGGGELIEVVASDNVSVPGRLPDPVSCARESVVPQSPAGIDLAEFPPASDSIDNSHGNPCSRVSVYLEQGVRPLISAVGNETPRIASREGAPLLVVCGDQDAGVTTVSWKLAQAMTAQGRRAVWVDADLSTRTEFRPANGHEGALADVLSGRLTVHEVLSLGPDGVQCIQRALGDRPLNLTEADASRCVRQLKELAPHAELLIADAGGQVNVLQSELWRAASAICVVVTPADENVLRGYASIKRYQHLMPSVALGVLVNRAEPPAAGSVFQRMEQACRQFFNRQLTLVGSLAAGDPSKAELDPAAERLWNLLTLDIVRQTGNGAATRNR